MSKVPKIGIAIVVAKHGLTIGKHGLTIPYLMFFFYDRLILVNQAGGRLDM